MKQPPALTPHTSHKEKATQPTHNTNNNNQRTQNNTTKHKGAADAVVTRHHSLGGAGAVDLARAVAAACERPVDFRFLYDAEALPIKDKIAAIAASYGASGVSYSPEAEAAIARYTRMGLGGLPVCMAKTQYSFSHDPKLKGAPSGFVLPVRDVRASAGAGFVFPLVGGMMTMPGLPTRPAYYDIDLDPATGRVLGLS